MSGVGSVVGLKGVMGYKIVLSFVEERGGACFRWMGLDVFACYVHVD